MPSFDLPEEDEEDTLRGGLIAAFEQFDAGKLTAENALDFELPRKDTPPTEADDKGAAESAAAPPEGQDKTSRDGRRDASGRFVKGEGEGAKAADASPAAATPDGQQPAAQQPEAKPADAAQPEPAPQGISHQAAAIWDKASPEVRQYVQDTERVLSQVKDGFGPVFEAAREINMTWGDYTSAVVRADRFIRQSPMDGILWLMDHYKIDPDAMADMAIAKRAGMPTQPLQQQAQQPLTPQIQQVVQPLAAQVQEIRSTLQQREQAEQQQRLAAAQARNEAAKREIDTFAKANATHWETVKDSTLALLPATRMQNPTASNQELLKMAYEAACWANPKVRTELQRAQVRTTQQQTRQSRSRDLEAMTDHRGGPVPARQMNGAHQDNSLNAEIRAAFDAFDNARA